MEIEAPKNICIIRLEIKHYAWLSFILGSLYKKWHAFKSLVDKKEHTSVYKYLKQIVNK